jgi:hypothetical protein
MDFEPEVAASLSDRGISRLELLIFYEAEVVPFFLQQLDNQYQGLHEYVRFRNLKLIVLGALCSATGRGIPEIISAPAIGLHIVIIVNDRIVSSSTDRELSPSCRPVLEHQ